MDLDRYSHQQTYYYWYYASLALYHREPEFSYVFDQRLMSVLKGLEGKKKHTRGSFAPLTFWARNGSRVYTTALTALILETHYRYVPAWMGKDKKGLLIQIYKRTPIRRRSALKKYILNNNLATENDLANALAEKGS